MTERADAIKAAIEQHQRDVALPRITEEQWDERFGWLPNDDGNCELLSETNTPVCSG